MKHLPLPLYFKKKVIVYGGPYRQKPAHMIGVKMAAEINLPAEVDIPTRDYSIPPAGPMADGLLTSIQLLRTGEPLYVGCMGGIGRTGLFLAILAKAWGIEDPVAYVRKHYLGHAVETDEQQDYVANYVIPGDVQRAVLWAKINLTLKKVLSK